MIIEAARVANHVWSMDFLSDQLFDGSKIRVLAIVDAYSRLSPAIDVRRRYRGADVVETLERVTAIYGLPKTIRVDNGPEFISKDLDLWAWMNNVTLDFSRPGKPTDNAFVESFNGKIRAEASTRTGSYRWTMPGQNARLIGESTTRNDHTAPSATRPRWSSQKAIGQPSQPVA